MFDNYLTTDALVFGTVTMLVRLFVHKTKGYVDRLTGKRLPTFFLAVIYAAAILFAVTQIRGVWTFEAIFLDVVNSFLVAVVSAQMGDDGKAKKGAA